MQRAVAFGTALALLAVTGGVSQETPRSSAGERRLTRTALADKIRGGWTGQMVGVAYAQETEFKAMGKMIEGPMPSWTPDLVARARRRLRRSTSAAWARPCARSTPQTRRGSGPVPGRTRPRPKAGTARGFERRPLRVTRRQDYDEILKHLGGLKPGESKPVPPFPEK